MYGQVVTCLGNEAIRGGYATAFNIDIVVGSEGNMRAGDEAADIIDVVGGDVDDIAPGNGAAGVDVAMVNIEVDRIRSEERRVGKECRL